MRIAKVQSWMFGFFAIWPFIIIGVLILVMSLTRFQPPTSFVAIWIALSIIFVMGWISYLLNVFRNERVPRNKRALWAALLFFAGPYAMPFYYWHYLRYEGDVPRDNRPA
jgi:hypothetical protein